MVVEDEESFVLVIVVEKFDNINLGLKVLMGIFIFFVLLIGVIIRLLVWGIKELVRKIKGYMLEKEYDTDFKVFLRKYVESIFEFISDFIKMKLIMENEVFLMF